MKLHYHPHRSRILEYLYFPVIMLTTADPIEEGFSQKEREAFKESLVILEELKESLAPFKEEINQTFLWGRVFSILGLAYFLILDRGKDPQDLEEFYREIEALTQKDIEEIFAMVLAETGERKSSKELLTLLEEATIKPEYKWYWYQAIGRPLEAIREAIVLHRKLAELYHPFYEQVQAEREVFAAAFSLEDLYERVPDMTLPVVDGLSLDSVEFMVFSPWLFLFCYYGNESYTNLGVVFCASVGIEHLFYAGQELDVDDVVNVLKTLSDVTRYQVMQALVKPHAKNKEIAKELGITGAAVSFHTQKLINSQILLFSQEDSSKFEVNKRLLSQVIERLQVDFELTDD